MKRKKIVIVIKIIKMTKITIIKMKELTTAIVVNSTTKKDSYSYKNPFL